jgi:hypothetical protein
MNKTGNYLFGLTAEFETPEALLAAAQHTRAAGYKQVRAYTPYEVEGLSDVLQHESPVMNWTVLIALIAGILGALAMQYWSSVVHYPINVGGRPDFALPAFIPIMFEAGVLFAGLAAFGFMIARSGLPTPYHPIFNVPGIEEASNARFFLCIQTTDPQFSLSQTRQFLQDLAPAKVSEVLC